MVGILAHEVAQAESVGELQGVVAQAQHHLGAPLRFRLLHAVFILAPGDPAYARFGICRPGQHFNFLGDDEGAVEANPELADQGGVLFLIAAQLAQELRRAGLGYGAEIVDHVLAAHADAVVGYGEGLGLLVKGHPNGEVVVLAHQFRLADRLEAQTVDRIRCVGDQFPQKHLPVGVQGVNHQLQQLLGFGLEAEGLGLGAHDVGLTWRRRGQYGGQWSEIKHPTTDCSHPMPQD